MKSAIYNHTLSLLSLSGFHEKELVEKRGFDKKAIEHYRFVSGGPYILKLEESIRSKFAESDLISSGIFIHDGKAASINPILLDERIIIPYLNKDRECYMLRPHKLGLSGVPIEVYQELNLWGDDIIITEGEFKAVAGCMYGLSTIAIPGISSFSEKHFPGLVKLLHEHKVKRVTMLFDNEVKDDPSFPERYKDNPNDRYDTQFYSYYMAKKLDSEGFDAKIAWLPDGWRVQGKIDIDGALALGKTKEDIRKIKINAKTHRQFLDEFDKDIRNILIRKNSQKRYRNHIKMEFGHYVAHRKRGATEWDEPISNFVIKIVATHWTHEGMVREIIFANEYQETSKAFSMTPEDMNGIDSFSKFCLQHGNFIWRGTKDDLQTIWEGQFMLDDGRHITEPDHIGWIDSEKVWLFGNIAITADGREMRPDKSHVFWMDKKGLKPIPLGVTTGRTTIAEGIPYISINEFDMSLVKSNLSDSIGKNEASLCLGWISAVPYLEEVFDKYGCFPFLFITGRRGSGKSTVAEWLMNFYGLENAGKMASDTTAVAVQRYLSYYSSLPVFLDEYRNTKQIQMKNGFFRNAYNRQSAGKGIKEGFGIREGKIRGTLLLAGEETPEDNALLTRCIVVLVAERNRTNNHFNWFQANRVKMSYHTLNILRNKKANVDRFLKILDEGKDYFVSKGADDRVAINYAVVAAGYAAAFGEGQVDFAKWLTVETQRVRDEYQDEQAVAQFMEDLIALKAQKIIDDRYWCEDNAGKVYLYFHGLYNIWSQEYRKTRGEVPFKASAIRDYLKEEPGYESNSEVKRIKGQLCKCIVFNTFNAPDLIKHLVEPTGIPKAEFAR